jgi:hypothetical protein
MPKIDRIVGKAVLNISDAADAIGHAASRVGERLSQTRRNLKDHIKLGYTKPKWSRVNDDEKEFRGVHFREDLKEIVPQKPRQERVPNQPGSRGSDPMMSESKIVLRAIETASVNRYVASLREFMQRAPDVGAKAASRAFISTFNGLTEREQASIRDNIRKVHSAAVELVKTKGSDPAVLEWSELMVKQLGKLAPGVKSEPDRVKKEDLEDPTRDDLAELPPPRVQPPNDGVLEDLLANMEAVSPSPQSAPVLVSQSPTAVVSELLDSMEKVNKDRYLAGLRMLRSVDTDETIDILSSPFLEQSDSSRQEILKGIEELHGAIVKQTNVARLDKESSAILLRILNIQEEIGLPAFSAMAEESQARPASPIVEQPPQAAGRQKTTRAWRRAQGPKSPVFLKPAENLPKSTASVSVQKGVDFLRIMDGTLVGGFVKTLHDLARARPEELTAFVTSLETALKYGPPQRASIERLNNLMDKVLKELAKDEAFIEDRGERVEKTWEIWMLLKTRIPSLVSRPKNSVADDDMKAAKAAFTEIYQA